MQTRPIPVPGGSDFAGNLGPGSDTGHGRISPNGAKSAENSGVFGLPIPGIENSGRRHPAPAHDGVGHAGDAADEGHVVHTDDVGTAFDA